MKKLTEEQILENLQKFYGYIDKYITSDRKDALLEFYKSREVTLVCNLYMRMPTDAFRFDKFALILIHLIVKKVFYFCYSLGQCNS